MVHWLLHIVLRREQQHQIQALVRLQVALECLKCDGNTVQSILTRGSSRNSRLFLLVDHLCR